MSKPKNMTPEQEAKRKAKNAERSKAYRAANRERERERQKARYAANRELINEQRKARYAANREREVERSRAYREANRELVNEQQKAYREANREQIAERNKVRRMNKRERQMIERSLLIKQAGKCACCKKPLPLDFHLDHIMPLALGGDNDANNFQALCGVCNRAKSAAHPVEHAQRMGKLL